MLRGKAMPPPIILKSQRQVLPSWVRYGSRPKAEASIRNRTRSSFQAPLKCALIAASN